MFRYLKEHYTKEIVPGLPPAELYDEKMVSDEGVSITYKTKSRELDDTFEYKDDSDCFLFSGDWQNDIYVVSVGASFNGLERLKNVKLQSDHVFKILNNIEEALKTWPLDGRIIRQQVCT